MPSSHPNSPLPQGVQARARGYQWWFGTPSRDWLDSRAGRVTRVGLHVILLGMLIVVSGAFVKALLTQRPANKDVTTPGITQTPPAYSIDALVATHLFGQTASETPATPQPAAPSGDISLVGILHAGTATDSRAIITTNGKTLVIAEGDSLPDGEKIVAIEAHAVTLLHGGAEMLLTLNFTDDQGAPSARIADASQVTGWGGQSGAVTTTGYPVPASYNSSGPTLGVPQVPASASPLEQMASLRSQLIRARPQER